MSELQCESFTVHFRDGTAVDYPKTEHQEFVWSMSPAGDLIIYEKQYHQTLSAVIKDARIAAYANGVWEKVLLLPEDLRTEDERIADEEADASADASCLAIMVA
jgi:hypothetical protein